MSETRHVQNIPFRRRLKHIFKQMQRLPSYSERNRYANTELAKYGLYGADLLGTVLNMTKARGKHFSRLGRAALKLGSLCHIHNIALYAEHKRDMRDIPFVDKCWFK